VDAMVNTDARTDRKLSGDTVWPTVRDIPIGFVPVDFINVASMISPRRLTHRFRASFKTVTRRHSCCRYFIEKKNKPAARPRQALQLLW
jgi:hypothetical protein